MVLRWLSAGFSYIASQLFRIWRPSKGVRESVKFRLLLLFDLTQKVYFPIGLF